MLQPSPTVRTGATGQHRPDRATGPSIQPSPPAQPLVKPFPTRTTASVSIYHETCEHRGSVNKTSYFKNGYSPEHVHARHVTFRKLMKAGLAAWIGTMQSRSPRWRHRGIWPSTPMACRFFINKSRHGRVPRGPGSIAASAATEPRKPARLRPFGVTIPHASAPLWRSTVVSKRRTTPDRDFWNIP